MECGAGSRSTRWLARAALLLAAVAAGFIAAPVAADVNVAGDLSISSLVTYTNQVINITNTTNPDNTTNYDGNLTILPGGELRLENCTLLLPFSTTLENQGTLVVYNSTINGELWMLWIRSWTTMRNVEIVNATHDRGGGLYGTYIINRSVTLDNVRWNRTNGGSGDIHLRVPLSFTDNFVGVGVQLSIELPTLSTATSIEIARNRFDLGGADTLNSILFADQIHTAAVTFDIHHNSINGGGNGILLQQSSRSTIFRIHDNTFTNIPHTAVSAGISGGGTRFDGTIALSNLSIGPCDWGIRFSGVAGNGGSGTIDNVTISGCTNGIMANEAAWVVRNSSFLTTNPQYVAETNGVILVYDTADTALGATATASGARVEHFVYLNLAGMSWQSSVPILGDNVSMLNATGSVGLTINASSWTPRLIVWWGEYGDGTSADNRDLRPVIFDEGRTFGCTPSQFFVSVGMPSVEVVCTDDVAPDITLNTPGANSFQNKTVISGAGRLVDAGSGLQAVEWSLDNGSFSPVTIQAGATLNFTFSTPVLSDGLYTIYMRASDRTGNLRYLMRGTVTVDTVLPALSVDLTPVFATGTNITLSGTSEPLTAITVVRVGGWNGSTTSALNGSFAITVPLEEGMNSYTVTARDRAGNNFSLPAVTFVDTLAPSLAVDLDGTPVTSLFTKSPSVRVAGVTEVSAAVAVNGVAASRSGQSFSLDLALTRGLNNITVAATDLAGNTALWFGLAYFDDDAPVLVLTVGIVPAADGVLRTRSASISLSGTASDASTRVLLLTVNGTAYAVDGAGGFHIALAIAEGENNLTVAASDLVGNTATRSVLIVRDTTAPQVTATLGAGDAPLVDIEGSTYTKGSTVKVTLVFSEAGTARIGNLPAAVVRGANNFTVELAEGRNIIAISFSDIAGNAGVPTTLGVFRDTSPPFIVVASPHSGDAVEVDFVELVGTAEPLAVVVVNGQPARLSALGEFRVVVPLQLGENAIVINATDSLGNANGTTLTVTRRAGATTVGGGFDAVLSLGLLGVGVAVGLAAGLMMRRRAPPQPAEVASSTSAPPAPPPPPGPRGPRPPPR